MNVYNVDGSTLMQITSLDRKGNDLVINGTIMESMPIRCVLTPTQARKGLGLIKMRLAFFLMTILFRS